MGTVNCFENYHIVVDENMKFSSQRLKAGLGNIMSPNLKRL